jgi:hypothetical protein
MLTYFHKWAKDAQNALTISHGNLDMRFLLQCRAREGIASLFERTSHRLDLLGFRSS